MNADPSVAARWQLRLLGALHLSDGPQRIARWPGRAAALLLARLALWPTRDHPREELVELLWPGVALDVGRNRLRQTLSTLRALIETPGQPPLLVADRLSVRAAPGALDCDVHRFERLLHGGRAAEALRCYGGELMPGFYDDWVAQERLRLAALAERALAASPDVRPAARAGAPGVPATAAPVDARVVLPCYLTRYFGGDPQAARLRGRVLAQRLVTLTGPGGSGKTRLAVEVAGALRHAPGWPVDADGAAGGFHEMAFVSLVGCSQGAQMVDAIATALRLGPWVPGGPGGATDRLASALGDRRLLLVLDNFEQLIGQAEPLVADLLAQLPGLHLLVTSRRLLGVDGEHCVVIEPLPLPIEAATLEAAAVNPAVALFVDRARAARADFHLSARLHADIAALVRALEGMPLAIELAAARIRAYSPGEMLQVLRPSESTSATAAEATPTLDLLSRGGPRTGLDARHASMQAAIEWSWQLLEPGPRGLLAGLTVFRGGFTAAAVRALAGLSDRTAGDEAHRRLDELVAHSLVHARSADDGGQRFYLYEPIREFAAARLTPADARGWRARHRRWLDAWSQGLPTTPDLGAVRAEMPNLEAMLAAAAAPGADDGADGGPATAQAVQVLLQLRRVLEDVELPAAALACAEAVVAACPDRLLQARGQSLLGPLLLMAGRGVAALACAEAGLAATPADAEPGVRGRALHALARVRWRRLRQAAGVLPLVDEAEPLALAAADVELQAGLLALRAFVVNTAQGDHATAYALHARALAHWQRLGNRHAVHSGLYNLAVTEQQAGRHQATLALLEPLRQSAQELQDWRRLSQAGNVAGNALSELRRWPEAAQSLRDALRQAWRSMAPYEMAYPLWNLPRALAHLRQPEAALKLAAFAATYWQAGFGALSPADQHDLRRVRRLVACQLGERRCQALWAEGEGLTLPQALGLALHP